MAKILITGGLGYIGSHTAVVLIEKGYEVVLVDNLSNTRREVLAGIEQITGKRPVFYAMDLAKKQDVADLFEREKDIMGAIHFAAYKAVGESVQEPLKYYQNNLCSLIYLLEALDQIPGSALIFSSSCTVYGQADSLPINERAPIKPAESPYGNTKQIGEEIIRDLCAVSDRIKAIALRYFNPIGAHSSALIGELPLGVPQNLVPFITQTAIGIRERLSVFGDQYPTPDGTCIRDYIHVVDLAEAHLAALERILGGSMNQSYEVFNVGTGQGNSVLEVVHAFEAATGVKLNYAIAPKRPGDVIAAYADTRKVEEVLGWKARHTLEESLASSWAWEQNIRKKQ
ncbi:MAG: hypothetical protein RLZZ593_955 [Bacteroidota bacterium]